MRDQIYIRNMVLTSLFMAVGLVLPYFFHLLGAGQAFLPMHLPVLVCGLVCGWQWGLLVGATLPLLSSLITGMPPLFPMAVAMMFELATYGFLSGRLLLSCSKRCGGLYLALSVAMLGGRLVSGVARLVLFGLAGMPFGWQLFISGALLTSFPGILLQLVIVPPLTLAIKRLPVNRINTVDGGF